MDSLIADLEQAQEGSRELDGKTHETIGKCPHWEVEYFAVQSDTGFQCKSCGESYVTPLNRDVPHYTTNLQDALGLVPEGTYWAVRTTGDTFSALVVPEDQNHRPTYAATPALALTIAALKARQEET